MSDTLEHGVRTRPMACWKAALLCLVGMAWVAHGWPASAAELQFLNAPPRPPGTGAPKPPAAAGQAAAPDRGGVPQWTALRGTAASLSVGADGTAYAVDDDGGVWRRAPGLHSAWVRMPGSFARVVGLADGHALGLEAGGDLRWYTGAWWAPLPVRAADVAVGPDGSVLVVVQAEQRVARLLLPGGSLQPLPATPAPPRRLSVDAAGQPWVLQEGGSLVRFDGRQWLELPGKARAIAAGAGGRAYRVDLEGMLHEWDASRGQWQATGQEADQVAVGPTGWPWIVTEQGRMFAMDLGARPGQVRRAAPRELVTLAGWRRIRGTAAAVAVGAGGAVYTLASDGTIWQWKGRNTWSSVPGHLQHLAVDASGMAWGLDENGHLLRMHNGVWADAMPISGARDLALSPGGLVWVLLEDGTPAWWDGTGSAWQPVTGIAARRIAAAPDGRPWVLALDGSVAHHDGSAWVRHGGLEARDLALGPDGTAFAVGTDHRPYRLDLPAGTWTPLDGEIDALAMGPGNVAWAVNARAEVLTTAPAEKAGLPSEELHATLQLLNRPPPGYVYPQNVLPLLPSAATRAGVVFRQVPGSAKDLAVGADGSIFAISALGNLYRWNNGQNAFLQVPGTLRRVAVGPDGRPWGVTPDGHVWYFDGTNWQQVPDIAGVVDIAVGAGGTVMAADGTALYRYDTASGRFQVVVSARGTVPPPPVRVAVDHFGNPWVITADNQFFRCDRDPCQPLPFLARSVAIGPEDTVFAVDLGRTLQRLSPGAVQFQAVDPGAVQGPDAIAVGPQGIPWLLTSTGQVFAAGFFPRDESRDIVIAQNTLTPPASNAIPGFSGFTFTKVIVWEQVSTQSMGFFTAMAIGAGGVAIAYNGQNGAISVYNATTKRFTLDPKLSLLPAGFQLPISDLQIAPDGTAWIIDSNASGGRVFQRRGSAWVLVSGIPAWSGQGSPSPMSVSIAPDGTVFGTSPDDLLYRFDAVLGRFVLFSPQPPVPGSFVVRVGPDDNPWIMSPFDAILSFDGHSWVNRNMQASFGVQQLSVGADGSVYVVPYQPQFPSVARWNPTSRGWDLIAINGTLLDGVNCISVGPDGRPWLLDTLGQVFRAKTPAGVAPAGAAPAGAAPARAH